MNNIDPRLLDAAIKASGGKIDRNDIFNAAKSGDTKQILNNLPESDRQKLNSLLSDKSALEKLLRNPQVAELMKKLSGGKNG
jgi:hypothetical protein